MVPISPFAGQGKISRLGTLEGLDSVNFSLAVTAHLTCYMFGKLLKAIHVRSFYTNTTTTVKRSRPESEAQRS
jgi:hypothetical protein